MPETESQNSGWNFPDDLPKAAWGLIANAWGGNWDDADPEWRAAAIRWRDAYHATLPETYERVPTLVEAVRQAKQRPGVVFTAGEDG